MFVLAVAFVSSAFAQDKITVSGIVRDNKNVPLPGAAVIQTGTSNGVSTDMDGKYSITVPKGAEVEFSCIGYSSFQIKAFNSSVDVVLEEDNLLLDETVVVGYGVQKKSSVTGAISQVKSEDIANRSVTDLAGSLQGKTAGIQIVSSSGAPGAESSIRIRGYSSNSSSDPLYVVDGLRTKNIANIDPSDIESIEVLKDAASAAIYGAQAGNGVVLVTTKRAAQGVTRVTYDMQLSWQYASHIPKSLNAKDYLTWVREGNLVSETTIEKYYDGVTDTNWADVAFETGFMQRHNVAFSGSNNNGSVYAAVSYLDNNGPVIEDKDIFKRLSATVNADYKLKKWLKFTTNNSFAYSKSAFINAGGMYSLPSAVIQMDPLTPVIYSKDNVPAHMQTLIDAGHYFITDKNGDYYSMSPFQETNNLNPYITVNYSDPSNERFELRGTTSLDFTPIKGLVITSRLGYQIRSQVSNTTTWPYTANTDTTYDYVVLTATSGTDTYYQWENFANYNKTFAEKHNLSAMIGMSYSHKAEWTQTGTVQGTGSDNLGITKLDPNYAYFSNQTGTATKTISGGEKLNYADLSYFGRIGYDYMSKYFLQVSLRADAADLSILPLNTRWGYFPAVSAGWTISREGWWQRLNLKPVTHLKFRASWGQNGSIAGLGEYMYDATISSTIKVGMEEGDSYAVGSVPNAVGNFNLKWETSEQLDFGFDLRMFSDRLTLTYDWFNKKTKDLIMPSVTSSLVVGGTLSPLNAGNVENKGHEIDLGWREKRGDFSYGISGNIATLKNKVTDIYETLTRVSGGSGGTGLTCYFEKDYPIWYMRGYKYTGVDNQTGYPTFEDTNKDGKISDDDKVMIGSGIPDFTYGITLNFSWKSLDLVVFGSGAHGNEIAYGIPRSTRMQANTLQYFFDRRWTTPGVDAKYPSAAMLNYDYDKYCQSSALVFDGSYFKIKQIQIGYTFPKKLISKIHLTNLRVYGSLDDFFLFTKYPGFDPEVSVSTSGLGIDYGQYPGRKKIVFGLNVAF